MASMTTVRPPSMATKGHTNLRYFPYGTRAIASPPMTTADVGVTRFNRPDALGWAVPTRLRLAPAKSASGAMIGIATVASPDDEGIKNDSGRNKRYITMANPASPTSPSAFSAQYRTVSVI